MTATVRPHSRDVTVVFQMSQLPWTDVSKCAYTSILAVLSIVDTVGCMTGRASGLQTSCTDNLKCYSLRTFRGPGLTQSDGSPEK